MAEVITVLGLDEDAALSSEACAAIESAELVAGGRRHLQRVGVADERAVEISAELEASLQRIEAARAAGQRVVVLCSGDPLFYGFGRRLAEHFGAQALRFVPAPTAVQRACARIGLPWDDARVVSVHGRPMAHLDQALAERPTKIVVYTGPDHDPHAIAARLHALGLAERYTMHVAEDLGGAAERVTELDPTRASERRFAALNVVILVRRAEPASAPLFGLSSDQLAHPRGQMTRPEVRLAALAALSLRPPGCLWDLGAGSGSVGLEAARLAPALRVCAVERDPEACAQIRRNRAALETAQVELHEGTAPDALDALPDPDAVFVGGSGGRLEAILRAVSGRLWPGGRIVAATATLEHGAEAWRVMGALGLNPEAREIAVRRSAPIGSLTRMAPEPPVVLTVGQKEKHS
jgi:precorrin-6Y C5,15-methyltransferase (decarboxylating)